MSDPIEYNAEAQVIDIVIEEGDDFSMPLTVRVGGVLKPWAGVTFDSGVILARDPDSEKITEFTITPNGDGVIAVSKLRADIVSAGLLPGVRYRWAVQILDPLRRTYFKGALIIKANANPT